MTAPFYQLPTDTDEDIENYAADVDRFLNLDLAPGIFKSRRVPRGVYEQRKDGTFMVRIRASAGRLTADQVRRIGTLGKQYSDGRLHVTTRLDIQLHSVDIADTPAIMRGLRDVGLSAKGGGGNTVRNVTACPYSGICRTEPFDVAPFSHAVTGYLISLPGSYNLPRKYKIAFSGCSLDCSLARVNDLGLFPEVRDEKKGFRIYVGGGLGAKSRIGDLLEEWIPAAEVIRVAEAVRRIFDRLGDRRNRKRARLRYVLERLGIDEFKRIYREEMAAVRRDGVPECTVDVPIRPLPEHAVPLPKASIEIQHGLRVVPEDPDRSRYSVRLHLPLGYISADALAQLGDLAGAYSAGVLRSAQSQDLLLTGVAADHLAELAAAVNKLQLDSGQAAALVQFVACAGASTCRLGLCLSRGAAKAAAEALDQAGLTPATLAEMRFNISGCPNACGQHPVAAVGFYGVAMRQSGNLLPAYRVVMGAALTPEDARLGTPIGTVPARRLPAFAVALARDFEELRGLDEPFSCYADRQGKDHFANLLMPYSRIPEYDEAPDVYRDWGRDTDFSLAGRGAGECGAGVFEVVANDIAAANKARAGEQDLWSVLLPTVRALLITRGVDDRAPAALLAAFRQHFIQTGLVDDAYDALLTKAEAYAGGDTEALVGTEGEVRNLLERVELLFSSLDSNLQFHPPEGGNAEANSTNAASDPGPAADKIDLRGIACPMNFVKTKLKLETMSTGATLDIVLDDGEPIRNVPASLRGEGHAVIDETDIKNGLWQIRVIKGGAQ